MAFEGFSLSAMNNIKNAWYTYDGGFESSLVLLIQCVHRQCLMAVHPLRHVEAPKTSFTLH